jgi:hypothetical protein
MPTTKLTIDLPLAGDEKESPDSGWPKEETFAGLLFKFSSELTNVVVSGSSRLATIVTAPLVASEAFLGLRTLALTSTFSNLQDPFHPLHYASLLYHLHLSTFTLNVLRSSESIKPYGKPFPRDYTSTFTPKALTLKGPIGVSPSCRDLVARFPRLVQLSLFDTSSDPSTGILQTLVAIVDKEELDTLSIGCDRIDEAATIRIIESLDRFHQLYRLKLSANFSFVSKNFYRALKGLDLLSVSFSEGAIVSSKRLRGLFQNCGGSAALVLDEVRWIDEEGITLDDAGSREDEVSKVVKMARKEGVCVYGLAIDEYYAWSGEKLNLTMQQLSSLLVEQLSLREVENHIKRKEYKD